MKTTIDYGGDYSGQLSGYQTTMTQSDYSERFDWGWQLSTMPDEMQESLFLPFTTQTFPVRKRILRKA